MLASMHFETCIGKVNNSVRQEKHISRVSKPFFTSVVKSKFVYTHTGWVSFVIVVNNDIINAF
jgi:hypothetical protein